MLINHEVFSKVNNKMQSYKFHKTVDINYCSLLSDQTMTKEKIQNLIKDWSYLNELSFVHKYDDEPIPETWMYQFIDFSRNYQKVNTYQFLKYLNAIQYNIEPQHIPEYMINERIKDSYKFLKNLIRDIEKTIISNIEQYKQAEWI
jgi:hypothetical protein